MHEFYAMQILETKKAKKKQKKKRKREAKCVLHYFLEFEIKDGHIIFT